MILITNVSHEKCDHIKQNVAILAKNKLIWHFLKTIHQLFKIWHNFEQTGKISPIYTLLNGQILIIN